MNRSMKPASSSTGIDSKSKLQSSRVVWKQSSFPNCLQILKKTELKTNRNYKKRDQLNQIMWEMQLLPLLVFLPFCHALKCKFPLFFHKFMLLVKGEMLVTLLYQLSQVQLSSLVTTFTNITYEEDVSPRSTTKPFIIFK